MPEVSIKDQIKKLVELQETDKEIFDLKKDLEEKPALLAQVKEEFENKKAGLKELEEKLKAIQVDRKQQELELQSKEEDISKGNTDLSQIKTNKEYTAKIKEIENSKADKSVMEERILVSYDKADEVNAEIDKEKKFLEEQEKNYLAQKKEVEDTVKILEDKIKVLKNKRNQVVPEVDKETLTRYERILEKKEGLAIVPVQGNSCGGCFMNVTPQAINEIKMHEKLMVCEMCARILYLEDDL